VICRIFLNKNDGVGITGLSPIQTSEITQIVSSTLEDISSIERRPNFESSPDRSELSICCMKSVMMNIQMFNSKD
jgi:hypothetical protein